ncbi:MAG: hypothetical protein NT099_07660 [Candidatus Saganbacteria bacterium]|nr:hypothetical protein [Candidatus Saganbacteria bacterium]
MKKIMILVSALFLVSVLTTAAFCSIPSPVYLGFKSSFAYSTEKLNVMINSTGITTPERNQLFILRDCQTKLEIEMNKLISQCMSPDYPSPSCLSNFTPTCISANNTLATITPVSKKITTIIDAMKKEVNVYLTQAQYMYLEGMVNGAQNLLLKYNQALATANSYLNNSCAQPPKYLVPSQITTLLPVSSYDWFLITGFNEFTKIVPQDSNVKSQVESKKNVFTLYLANMQESVLGYLRRGLQLSIGANSVKPVPDLAKTELKTFVANSLKELNAIRSANSTIAAKKEALRIDLNAALKLAQ